MIAVSKGILYLGKDYFKSNVCLSRIPLGLCSSNPTVDAVPVLLLSVLHFPPSLLPYAGSLWPRH